MSWLEGAANGGTPVIDYTVWYDQGTDSYTELVSGITDLKYTATTLTMGTLYKFKIQSRNAFGLSVGYSNEVSIL